jgi:hypothetical protein
VCQADLLARKFVVGCELHPAHPKLPKDQSLPGGYLSPAPNFQADRKFWPRRYRREGRIFRGARTSGVNKGNFHPLGNCNSYNPRTG